MRALGLIILFAGCSGTAHQVEIGAPPPKVTRAVLQGPLCNGDSCKCREGADDPGTPQDGKKRFEIRLDSPYELWVTLPGMVLYKSAERAQACFYVDLSPGDQPIELRASQASGVSAAMQIHEYGTATKSWYDTFGFSCGVPGVCSYDELDQDAAGYANRTRNKLDVCGSVKVKGIDFRRGKAPDQEHPSELAVNLTLDIYKHAPWKQHGDATCGNGEKPPKSSPGDEPAAP